MPAPPEVLTGQCERFDATAFDAPSDRARLRLVVDGAGEWDFVVNGSARELEPAEEKLRPDARLSADRASWSRVGRDLRGGMNAFRRERLQIRDNLHLGVGFLAATSGSTDPARLEMGFVRTPIGDIAVARAGDPHAQPVVMLHGLGGTKGSFPADGGRARGFLPHARHRPAGLRRLRQARRGRLRPALLRQGHLPLHGCRRDRERAP